MMNNDKVNRVSIENLKYYVDSISLKRKLNKHIYYHNDIIYTIRTLKMPMTQDEIKENNEIISMAEHHIKLLEELLYKLDKRLISLDEAKSLTKELTVDTFKVLDDDPIY